MTTTTTDTSAHAGGTFLLGGDLAVNRMGFGAMRITGKGIWGEPENPEQCKARLAPRHRTRREFH